MCKVFYSIIVYFFLFSGAIAQKVTVNGIVTDAETKEILIGARIEVQRISAATSTNSYGFYSLKINKGHINLSCSHVGYEDAKYSLTTNQDTTINIELKPISLDIPEIVISVSRNSRLNNGLGAINIPISIIKKTPTFFGESDLMKSLQSVPGVKNTSEGKSNLTIRGGSPDQNLLLLDGIPVYNPGHIFGFLSVFNSDALKNVTLYKSGFPARFGGRLSSVVDINTKDGNKDEISGSASLGLLAANFNIEGPIIRGRTSFFISARRSIIDLYFIPLQNQFNSAGSENEKTNFRFYDLNAKIHHKIGEKTSFYVLAYNGEDKLMNRTGSIESEEVESCTEGKNSNSLSEQHWQWGNSILAMRLNRAIAHNMFINGTIAYNNYHYRTKIGESYIYENEKIKNSFDYKSGINDYSFMVDYDYVPSNNHILRSGLQFIVHHFRPEVLNSLSENKVTASPVNSVFRDIRNKEYSFFIEDEWKITPHINTNIGLRLTSFGVDGITYNTFDPRCSLKYLFSDKFSVIAEYSRMSQNIHLLSNNSLLLQTDLWVPSTRKVKPMKSDQLSLGTNISVNSQIIFSVSGYYKDMKNVIEYKDGASLSGISNGWENKVESGIGRSYGIEFALEKELGKTTGSVAYTLSKNERLFNEINDGKWFPSKYDRRHMINVAISHILNSKWNLIMNWSYSSGNMMTLPLMTTVTPDIPYYPFRLDDLIQLDHRNNYRMPGFHRLDFGVNYAPNQKKKRYGSWNFSIYNVYNRKNPFKIYSETDVSRNEIGEVVYTHKLKQISLFPFMPSLSYTYKF